MAPRKQLLSEESAVPLYDQLRQELEARIMAGEWSRSDTFPTEEGLCEEYGISRGTVRRALEELSRKGLLYRKPGKGSFVKEPRLMLRLERPLSYSMDMLDRGLTPGAKLISVRVTAPDQQLARDLHLVPGEKVVEVRRVRLADSLPTMVTSSSIPLKYCNGLQNDDLSPHSLSLFDVLRQKYGIRMAYCEGQLVPVIATDEEALSLEVARGSPLFEMRTITFNERQHPVIVSVARSRSDRHHFSFSLDTA
jgi:GntR family transcriptional regulator